MKKIKKNYNEKSIYLSIYLISILFFSCSEDYNKAELQIQEDFVIENNLIKFESKAAFYNTYNEIKVIGAEVFYDTKIKVLGKEKFQSLHPFFGKDEEKELINFLIKKKERYKNKLNKTFNKSENGANDDFIEVDDDIISDPNFAVLLNENREIIVEGKLYRYQGDGVYD